jgi:hypothetical protein
VPLGPIYIRFGCFGALGQLMTGRKKKVTKVTYFCRSPKKKVLTYPWYFILFSLDFFLDFFYRVFGRFVTRAVQKHEKELFGNPSRLWAHHKKMWLFFLCFFFFSLGCFARFVYRVLGVL